MVPAELNVLNASSSCITRQLLFMIFDTYCDVNLIFQLNSKDPLIDMFNSKQFFLAFQMLGFFNRVANVVLTFNHLVATS